MKQFVIQAGSLVSVIVFLLSCAGKSQAKHDTARFKSTEKVLTLDQKAENTFKNTTIVFSGSLLVAFSGVFKDRTQTFSEIFASEMNRENLKILDERIASLGEQTMKPLEGMMKQMDSVFNKLAEENYSIYKKMFLHDVMKEGVDITEKYNLPEGFRPLSQNLSQMELKRYIFKVSADGQNTEDPVIKTYIELFEWLQRVGEKYNTDTEFQTFIRKLRS